ncbi:BEL1-like homeodomain protein 3 [Tanacetum coccineum]
MTWGLNVYHQAVPSPMESFVPFGGFLSMPSYIKSTLRISDYFGFLRHICDDKFKLKVNAISKVGLYGSVSDPFISQKRSRKQWSVRMDGVRVQDELKEYNGPRHEIETRNKVTKLFSLLDEITGDTKGVVFGESSSWDLNTLTPNYNRWIGSSDTIMQMPKAFSSNKHVISNSRFITSSHQNNVIESIRSNQVSELRYHIDLNLTFNEEEDPSSTSSIPEAVVKIATMEIDLEAPTAFEPETDDTHKDIIKAAAEAIISISSFEER